MFWCLARTTSLIPPQPRPSITGDYSIIGSTTDGDGEYTGSLSISRKGEVYKLIWTTGNGKFTGTGLITKGVLSAVWHQADDIGVSSFIIEEGKLVGTWAYLKSDGKRYKEVATKAGDAKAQNVVGGCLLQGIVH